MTFFRPAVAERKKDDAPKTAILDRPTVRRCAPMLLMYERPPKQAIFRVSTPRALGQSADTGILACRGDPVPGSFSPLLRNELTPELKSRNQIERWCLAVGSSEPYPSTVSMPSTFTLKRISSGLQVIGQVPTTPAASRPMMEESNPRCRVNCDLVWCMAAEIRRSPWRSGELHLAGGFQEYRSICIELPDGSVEVARVKE